MNLAPVVERYPESDARTATAVLWGSQGFWKPAQQDNLCSTMLRFPGSRFGEEEEKDLKQAPRGRKWRQIPYPSSARITQTHSVIPVERLQQGGEHDRMNVGNSGQ